MNPYVLLSELNKQVRAKYDMQFVHVKYLMSNWFAILAKNEEQKRLNEIYID
jgi:hypothetical protein